MQFRLVSIFLLMTSGGSFGQEKPIFFYDSLKQKTIYPDSLEADEVRQMAGDFYYLKKYPISDLLYTYLLSKTVFRSETSDTLTPLANRSEYLALTHLELLKHNYVQAQHFLNLSQIPPRLQHWCGNAVAAALAREEAYKLECDLGLAQPSEKKACWKALVTFALAPDQFGSPQYGGFQVVNYLRQRYRDEEIIYLFRKSRETISSTYEQNEYVNIIHAEFTLLETRIPFDFYTDETEISDPDIRKKITATYLVEEVRYWVSQPGF